YELNHNLTESTDSCSAYNNNNDLPHCVSSESGTANWTRSGCTLLPFNLSTDSYATCSCSHLSDFALIIYSKLARGAYCTVSHLEFGGAYGLMIDRIMALVFVCIGMS